MELEISRFRAAYDDGATMDVPPDGDDLDVPMSEKPACGRIVSELGITEVELVRELAEDEHVQGIRVGGCGFQKLKEPLRETPGISATCIYSCASHKILDFFVRCTNYGQRQGAKLPDETPGKRLRRCPAQVPAASASPRKKRSESSEPR